MGLMKTLTDLFQKSASKFDGPEEEWLAEWFDQNRSCPTCKSKIFHEGPSGGMSTNFECAGCGSRYNIAIAYGAVVFVQRLRGPQEETVP